MVLLSPTVRLKPLVGMMIVIIQNPDQLSSSHRQQPHSPQNEQLSPAPPHRLRHRCNMASLTNAQLRERIMEYGEQPPTRWNKAELLLRLEELSGKNTFSPAPRRMAEKTEYQQLVQDLNTASRKKADLILFCTKQLRINVSESMTMNAMKRQAMLHIYQKSRPDPTDTVGFGKHSSLSYEEIKEHQPEYAKWVLVTARESSEADPRLLRLAGWLENNPSRVDMASQKMAQQAELRRELRMPMPEVDKPKGKKVEKAGSSHSASVSDTESASSSKIDMLATVVNQLREEIADMKKDREPRRKKTTTEPDTEMSEGSYAMVPPGKGVSKTQGPSY